MAHEPPPTRTQMRASLSDEVAAVAAEGRLRVRSEVDGPAGRQIAWRSDGQRRVKLLNWASNDYLGAIRRRVVVNAAARAARQYGSGSGSARLLAGGLRCHRRLEQRLAGWLGTDDALLTSTGYQANLALLGALAAGPEDVLLLDRLCHASMYDGARLAAGTMQRFAHNDPADLEKHLARTEGARRRVVCVEAVYSMDGDCAPLAAISALCDQHGALLVVDEAHAIGVYGPDGRGCCAAAGIVPDALVGTCSKSLGSQGGFIAGTSAMVELVVNRGRAFIFSTAPTPAASGAATAMLDVLRDDPGLGAELRRRAAKLRAALAEQGWQLAGESDCPIIPVVVGSEDATLSLASALRERGHHCPAIRPPTVPPGGCRLRISLTLHHRAADVRRLLRTLAELRPKPA